MGVDVKAFNPVKESSKFMIIMAMAAIGLNSNVVQLIKTGGKPLLVGTRAGSELQASALLCNILWKFGKALKQNNAKQRQRESLLSLFYIIKFY